MNKFLKNSFGILIIIVPFLLLIVILFNNLSTRSFYPTSGEVKVSGLKSQVDVYFDDYGVPHIFAHNEDDAYFSLGYMHARDRLWQMDLARRLAEGRLSEIFGIYTMPWASHFMGVIAVHSAMQGYVATVQELIGKLFADPEFAAAGPP